ncbi:hypothetical protein D187_001340 [Cystobacter fuscus DSM 2262]|uniref:Uncharacterized protein n=1 Tax=Cystobacter fuscus (strain ATCC 25194 / DSM 2262 / NBRC 100088 / M29) TaxID=1242864 RepID=S9PC88_CYSF2|nr:hypothetical protein D187_001340 [Cystobacter fuscus DSM 2262]
MPAVTRADATRGDTERDLAPLFGLLKQGVLEAVDPHEGWSVSMS